jgi:hypothetical protein
MIIAPGLGRTCETLRQGLMQHPTGTVAFKYGSQTIDDRSHAQTYRPLITSPRARLESISSFLQATGTDKPLVCDNEC